MSFEKKQRSNKYICLDMYCQCLKTENIIYNNSK